MKSIDTQSGLGLAGFSLPPDEDNASYCPICWDIMLYKDNAGLVCPNMRCVRFGLVSVVGITNVSSNEVVDNREEYAQSLGSLKMDMSENLIKRLAEKVQQLTEKGTG